MQHAEIAKAYGTMYAVNESAVSERTITDSDIERQYGNWWCSSVGLTDIDGRKYLDAEIVWPDADGSQFDESNTLTYSFKPDDFDSFHQAFTDVWMPHSVSDSVRAVLFAYADYLDVQQQYVEDNEGWDEFGSFGEFWKTVKSLPQLDGGVSEADDGDADDGEGTADAEDADAPYGRCPECGEPMHQSAEGDVYCFRCNKKSEG